MSGAMQEHQERNTAPLLAIRDLCITAEGREVVSHVNFTINAGEHVAIIGESGAGKSLTCLSILGLLPAGIHASGSIIFAGEELIDAPAKHMQQLRGDRISAVFQDPNTSLDPLQKIWKQLGSPLRAHNRASNDEQLRLARALARSVSLPEPDEVVQRYPFELSGGQRQRVAIGMALALSPDIIIADEPTTALDSIIQRHILTLLNEKVTQTDSSLILVTHDLAVAAHVCQRAVVMLQGKIEEDADIMAILQHPQAPYTRILVDAAYTTHLTVSAGNDSPRQGSSRHV